MTSNTIPEVSLNEIQGTSNTGTNTLISEEFPLMNLMANEKEKIPLKVKCQNVKEKIE